MVHGFAITSGCPLRRILILELYTSIGFGQRCREAGVHPSMSTAGDAYNNAMCESFFGTLQADLLMRERFDTRAQARRAIFRFIEPGTTCGACIAAWAIAHRWTKSAAARVAHRRAASWS